MKNEVFERCPKCHTKLNQVKDGFTPSGSQRYRCRVCSCRYTPWPKERGYDDEVRLQALRLHLEGMSLRAISRILQINHQTAANWINAYANHLPPTLPDSILELVELDRLLD
jgi:transposase-like protein